MKNFIFLLTLCFGIISLQACNKDKDDDDMEEMEDPTGCDAEGDCLYLTVDGVEFKAKFTQGVSIDLLGSTTLNFTGLKELTSLNSNAVQIVIMNPQVGSLDYTFTQSGEPVITFYNGDNDAIVISQGNLNILQYNSADKFIEGEFSGGATDTNSDPHVITNGYFKVKLQ